VVEGWPVVMAGRQGEEGEREAGGGEKERREKKKDSGRETMREGVG